MIDCFFIPRVSQCPCSEVPQQMEKVFEVIKGLKRHSHKSGSTGVQVQSFWSKPSTILSFIKRHLRGAFIHPDIILTDAVQSCHIWSIYLSSKFFVSSLESHWMVQIYHVRMYGPICTYLFIHPTMYMPCTVTLWSLFYYQVNEWIIPTKTSSLTCWSINLNQHSVVIIILSDEGRWETFGQC